MKKIEDLSFRYAYWEDAQARDAFKEFLISIHGLDLSLWEKKGFWDTDLYTPFSLFDKGNIVSHLCLYSMEMMIEGKARKIGQFSGVGTHPDYRRQGLSRWLTEKALQWASPTHDGFFLFSTDQALPFYANCGFVPVQESIPTLKTDSPNPVPGLRKLDTKNDEDLERIYDLARERTPVSGVLGVKNAKLLMFHCLYTLADHAYYIPDLDLVILFKVDGDRLILYDVLGRRVPAFAEIHPYIALKPHREVWFQFVPDKMGIEATGRAVPEGNNTHVLPPFKLPEPNCIVPFVARA